MELSLAGTFLYLLIVVTLLFLLTSIFSPGSTDGVVPGAP